MGPETILIVDDDEDSRAVFAAILRHHGYGVLSAMDGEQGVRLARESRPAMILMDLSLPVLDGWTATRLLKREPQTAAIPIIILSAHAMDEDRERGEELGCDSYLTKPCSPMALLGEVQRVLKEVRN